MAKSDTDIIAEAKERYKMADEAWDPIYKEALNDLNFVYDVDQGQWPEEVKKERKGRPMITINKLLKFVRKLRGETRINRPRIKVIPVDDQADPEKAKLYDGIIRMIEYQSSADVAYDTAYQYAISCSIGFMRLLTDYEDELSFDQKLIISRIQNFASVRIDPRFQMFDSSDIEYAFIEENLSENAFKDEYPKADFTSFKDASRGTEKERWYENKKVKIAEYFYKEYEDKKIGLVEMPGQKGDIHTGIMELNNNTRSEIARNKGRILKERDTEVATINWCKLTGNEILDRKIWIGKYIPIIPMFGDEVIVDGQRYLLSLIRGAKEPQRMYNYWSSAATEAVALIPKSPYILTAKQVGGYEKDWDEANTGNRPYMRYKSDPAAPPPMRQPQAQIPTGMITMMQNASIEIEDHLGQYEASKGAPSNERSGAAIEARASQSDKGTFTFVDNETRAITYLGRQLLDLIPKIYDSQRALAIMGEDGSQQTINVNSSTGNLDPQGNPIIENDLKVGRFDLIATVGASYASRREEAAADMKEVMQYAPALSSIIAPLFFKYSDWPGAQEIYADLQKQIQQQQEIAMQMQQQGQQAEPPPKGGVPGLNGG